jgi:hypothetical protein
MVGISIAFVGLASNMGYLFSTLKNNNGCDPSLPISDGTCEIVVFNWKEMVGHIGFALYMYEGNAAVVNLRAESKSPQDYPKILTGAFVT